MPWLTEDRERLEGFRRGDPRVLAEVYRVYRSDLARYLSSGFTFKTDDRWFRFHGVSAPFDLDDLVQESFARAFGEASRKAYDGVRPFGAWLTVIARNLVVDRWRRAGREGRLVTRLRDQEAALSEGQGQGLAGEADERLADAEIRAAYEAFVSDLTPELRSIWQLRFEERTPRKNVSSATGLSSMQLRWRERKLEKLFTTFFTKRGFELPRSGGPTQESCHED